MSVFTKKHYGSIAAVLRDLNQEGLLDPVAVESFMIMFENDSESFDRPQFLAAVYPERTTR